MLINYARALFWKKFYKYHNMKRHALKEQLYGGILEMTKNRSLFNKSDIGRKHEYSTWTKEGEQELLEFMKNMVCSMLICEDAEIDAKAKEMTFNALKAKE